MLKRDYVWLVVGVKHFCGILNPFAGFAVIGVTPGCEFHMLMKLDLVFIIFSLNEQFL